MEEFNEWENFKIKQRKILFNSYITKIIEENDENMKNGKIDNLIYSKNKFLLVHMKKNDVYKNIKNEDITIKNSLINNIDFFKTNEEGLIYYTNNIKKEFKMKDYKNNKKLLKT